MKEQHSSRLRKIGATLHHLWNLRKESLLWTPVRQCTMISKKDLSEAEMDTLTKSCSPTIVITANGEVQTQEEGNGVCLKYSMRGLLQPWTKSSIIPISEEESVWRNKRPRSRTVSFAEDWLLTWLTNTSGSLEPTILPRTMRTYSLLVLEMTIFRNSIQSGTEFYYQWRKSHLMIPWIVQMKNTRVWENSRPYWNCMTWSQIENDGEKKYGATFAK